MMRNELLLQATKQEISTVPKEFGTMFFIANVEWISSKEMKQLSKCCS